MRCEGGIASSPRDRPLLVQEGVVHREVVDALVAEANGVVALPVLPPAHRPDVPLVVEIDVLPPDENRGIAAGVAHVRLQHFRAGRIGDHREVGRAVAAIAHAGVVVVPGKTQVRHVLGLQEQAETVEGPRAVREGGAERRGLGVQVEAGLIHELVAVAQHHRGVAATERLGERRLLRLVGRRGVRRRLVFPGVFLPDGRCCPRQAATDTGRGDDSARWHAKTLVILAVGAFVLIVPAIPPL